jgi:hypothetical protein
LAVIVTDGKEEATSSLVIVTVALLGLPTVYAALALNATTTVSLLSTAVSLIGVTVFVTDADPAGIVTLVPMLV